LPYRKIYREVICPLRWQHSRAQRSDEFFLGVHGMKKLVLALAGLLGAILVGGANVGL